jgi:hypothetical protein
MNSETSLDPHVEEILHGRDAAAPRARGPLTRLNRVLARYGMYLAWQGSW